MLRFVLLFISLFFLGEAFEADRVNSLPGLDGSLGFKTYSGYLDGSTPGTHLHYIFVESQNDPANDPLLLWLNGGPGCSSLLGFFTEQGPFRVNGTQLTRNDYSWNKVANMIFLESPAGVGYSYADDRDYVHDDDKTSANNLAAIKSWYEKFPQFKTNDFYLTGESYAGVYVPTLSARLLNEPSINYKGFAIGNGYLDQILLGNSIIRFAYYHGLIDTSLWYQITSACCVGNSESIDACQFVNNTSPVCNELVNLANDFLNDIDLNPYAIYEDCQTADNSVEESIYNKYKSKSNKNKIGWSLISHSLGLNGGKFKVRGEETIPCVDDTILINYLGQSDVREALNIPSIAPEWVDCSDEVSNQYTMQYITLRSQVADSIKAGKKGLIYNGDVDMVCDFFGDQLFSDSLGFQQVGTYQPWYVDDQVAGFVKHYRGFAFVTVRGSGHTVPEYRPAAALAMITQFLSR